MPHERGAKDVVFLGEYETVKVLVKFDQGRGKYMIHCHNLSHEDHDMMGQFEIVDDTIEAHDPLADPCQTLPEGDL
jgi:FtsP/CotA-like multicopper oxidase with cupredoxin domain